MVERRTAARVGLAVSLARPRLGARCVAATSAAEALARAQRTRPHVAVEVAATVPEDAAPRELVDTVRTASRAHPDSATVAPTEPSLTPRQREILELIASGATNREIADTMLVGRETVRKEASAIFRRLGVRNRTEATRRYAAAAAPRTHPASRAGS